MKREASFSQDGKHRYWLSREWDPKKEKIVFIGLNPSTADDKEDDPTIESCIRITDNFGYGGFYMLNLYTFITSDPKVLLANFDDANRKESNHMLESLVTNLPTVCAWGNWKFVKKRVEEIAYLIRQPLCLGVNKNGSPRHPLFMKGDTPIGPYQIKI